MAIAAKYGKGSAALPATSQDMTKAFFWEFAQRYRFLAPNLHVRAGYEMDIMGIRKSGLVDEIEIKLSRSDFLADFKKTATFTNPDYDRSVRYDHPDNAGRDFHTTCLKHDAIAKGKCITNYFSFLLPADLAEQCESDIPDHAGLYVFGSDLWFGKVKTVKKAPRLHTDKIPAAAEKRYMEKICWRYRAIITNDAKTVDYEYRDYV